MGFAEYGARKLTNSRGKRLEHGDYKLSIPVTRRRDEADNSAASCKPCPDIAQSAEGRLCHFPECGDSVHCCWGQRGGGMHQLGSSAIVSVWVCIHVSEWDRDRGDQECWAEWAHNDLYEAVLETMKAIPLGAERLHSWYTSVIRAGGKRYFNFSVSLPRNKRWFCAVMIVSFFVCVDLELCKAAVSLGFQVSNLHLKKPRCGSFSDGIWCDQTESFDGKEVVPTVRV